MKKIGAREFLDVMFEANRRYQVAVREYIAIEKKGMPAGGFAQVNGDLGLAEKKMEELRDEIVWLVGGLLSPGSITHARLARRTATELLGKPKCLQKGQISSGGFRVPFRVRNAYKGKR